MSNCAPLINGASPTSDASHRVKKSLAKRCRSAGDQGGHRQPQQASARSPLTLRCLKPRLFLYALRRRHDAPTRSARFLLQGNQRQASRQIQRDRLAVVPIPRERRPGRSRQLRRCLPANSPPQCPDQRAVVVKIDRGAHALAPLVFRKPRLKRGHCGTSGSGRSSSSGPKGFQFLALHADTVSHCRQTQFHRCKTAAGMFRSKRRSRSHLSSKNLADFLAGISPVIAD